MSNEKTLGPLKIIKLSCITCVHCVSIPHAFSHEVTFDVLCDHPNMTNKNVGYGSYETPTWCPYLN